MKKITHLLAVLIFMLTLQYGSSYAQGTWSDPLSNGSNYSTQNSNGSYFVSATQGWAVGSGGAILTTSNGGTTWTPQISGTTNALTSVYFTSATQGWAAGASGTILTTSNGGVTWTAQTTGGTTLFKSIYFTSATQGWAVGFSGVILTTNNGGTTWTAQTSGTTNALYGVYFTSATQGWAVSTTGQILTTSDGGTTWTTQTSGITTTLSYVYFTSATQGWAVGANGKIITTNDGGTTWSAQTSGTSSPLLSVYFTSAMHGWAVGNSGTILTTSDGGTTWTPQTSGTTNGLTTVYFTSSTQGWALGANGTILVTSDGGVTWTAQTFGTGQTFNSAYFTSATQGWAVGTNGTILTTSNGGTTWTVQTSGTTSALNSVHFTSTTQGWLAGASGTILTTINGGTTWTVQTSGTTNGLTSVYFTSATQGWAVGAAGTILTTSNGGATWTAQTSGMPWADLTSVYFISATQGWAAGSFGTILTTSNGGTTWTTQNPGTTWGFYAVYFTSTTQGWLAGASGTILTTSNGGTTWTVQTSGTTNALASVYFTSATQGWAVGATGTILTTSDGGTTWTAQTSGTTNNLKAVNFTSATKGWAVGASGTILSYNSTQAIINTTTIAACDTYIWANNGQTYATTGVYTGTTTNNVTEKLDLTITPSVTYYADADADGFGNAAISQISCTGAPVGYVSNSLDCNDTNDSVHPGAVEICGDGIDNDCNGIVDETCHTEIKPALWNTTLASLDTQIIANATVGAQMYRFEVSNGGTTNTFDTPKYYFDLTKVTSTAYATTYSIRVALKIGGTWGVYGNAHNVTTPALASNTVLSSKLLPAFCGVTLPALDTKIGAVPVYGVNGGYRFEITTGGVITIYDSAVYNFRLADAGVAAYGTTYSIRVAAQVNGVYGNYGAACNVSTPAAISNNVPTTNIIPSLCGTTLASKDAKITAVMITGATNGRYEITKAGSAPVVYEVASTVIKLSQTGVVVDYNTDYTIRVAAFVSGVWGNYGASCTVTTPAAPIARLKAKSFEVAAFPNPFETAFNLNIETPSKEEVTIAVYDMMGKLVETHQVNPTDLANLQIGNNFAAGIYNVIVSQANEMQAIRLIRK